MSKKAKMELLQQIDKFLIFCQMKRYLKIRKISFQTLMRIEEN